MNESRTAVSVGQRFVLVTADDLSGGQAQFHVSIAVGSEDEVSAAELDVTASAAGTPLEMTEGPSDGPLPTIASRAMAAFAQYTFANPDDATPVVVTVSIGGESADFELSGAPPVA